MYLAKRFVGIVLGATGLAMLAGNAGAVPFADRDILVNNSTQGYYNTGLGMLLNRTNLSVHPSHSDGTGLGIFPCNHTSGVCGGDPTVNLIDEGDLMDELAAVSGILGNWLDLDSSNTIADIGLTGSGWSGAPQAIPTTWPINTEVAIVYEFGIGSDFWTEVELHFGVDNGAMIWLDGEYIFGAMRSGAYSATEYVLNLSDLSNGTHYLQVLLEDHGGSNGFLIDLRGTPVNVPEPGTLALLGLGLAGLRFVRRRKTA